MPARVDLLVYTDGAARGNPGPAAAGYAMFTPDGRLVEKGARTLGRRTTTEAASAALIWAVQRAKAVTGGSVRFHSDSELMVRQVTGRYQVRKEHLRALVERVRAEAAGLGAFRIVHVPRETDGIRLVDGLVNDELDRQGF